MASSLITAWAKAAEPPPDFTISEWADAKRLLPETSGARGARWRTDAAPYLRGVMDAPKEPGVRLIAVRKCHQVGGSEALHNIVGYYIEHDPCPILFVHPTAGVAEEWSKERLADMIRSTPGLSEVVRDKRAPRGNLDGSTQHLKLYPGGFLALGGANTPNTFARRSVRIAIGDDVDRFPAVVGEEGDPADLLVNRTTSFYDGLTIFVSTPTIKGGRIDTLYERSDRRQYHVRCLACGREDWITWNDPKHFRVGYDDDNPATARLECPGLEAGGCGAHFEEPARRRMVAEGRWLPTAVAPEPGVVGFHLPAMLSTLGAVTLPYLVEKWLSARARGKEATRVFINTSLAEGWEDRGARVEPHTLLARRESYGAEGVEVPAEAVVLTAGVDVQAAPARVEVHVQAWGRNFERWVVDYRVLPGEIKLAETKEALLEQLRRTYLHASGHRLPIAATCIDSGDQADEVYDFVLAHQHRRIYATKGYGNRSGTPIVGKPSDKTFARRGRPVRVYPINVDDAKAEVLAGVTLATPGPGYLHVPAHHDGVDEEFFAQLCAEHRETRYNRQGVATHQVWVQDRDRNEVFDTAVLCLAAFRLLNPNIRQMATDLAALPVPGQVPAPSAAPPAPPPGAAPPGRRVSRSSYLR